MSSVHYSLSALVASTPHLLAYTIPLLLLSLLLTFAGTFLTLDRSRSFPSPSYTPVPLPGAFDRPKKRKLFWSLQGGIGGLASGYVFGLHLSTLLSLLVPAITPSVPLSPNSFLAVWILSAVATTVVGARYRYAALIFSAMSGGALLALGICVIIHPSLLPRQVLIVLFAIVLLAMVLLFSVPRLARLLHPTLRAATSSSGAFGLVLSIALLAHIPAWGDVWERLWLHDGESWGSPQEKGLSAAFCIFLSTGAAVDWLLNRWLGECPDEKWDNYLANYASNLPNDASRAGSFKPLFPNSFLDHLFNFSFKKEKDNILFSTSPTTGFKQPRGSISKDSTSLLPHSNQDFSQYPLGSTPDPLYDLPTLPSTPGFLKKALSQKMYKPSKKRSKNVIPNSGERKRIKFGGDLSSDSSDSDSETSKVRPWLKQKASLTASSSSPTMVNGFEPSTIDYDLELAKLKKDYVKAGRGEEVLDYSDFEEDLGSLGAPRKEWERVVSPWSPRFIKRHSTSTSMRSGTGDSGTGSGVSNLNVALPLGAVPATPSLIKALDRISVAQQDAFSFGAKSMTPPQIYPPSHVNVAKRKHRLDGMPRAEEFVSSDEENGHRQKEMDQKASQWEHFWKDVGAKANS
ncbi:hypothetical protein BDZ94DRAFT_1183248 [Collybia nuda]|uniref:DUF4203 domain-containing protein n=1 Tax=Collybia nuda TaxID=64659 RepID=A0A9P6CJ97_9AGAR|nr:hypothetical protein BDZ94DRAFT_1183248 [Collybia nuda]